MQFCWYIMIFFHYNKVPSTQIENIEKFNQFAAVTRKLHFLILHRTLTSGLIHLLVYELWFTNNIIIFWEHLHTKNDQKRRSKILNFDEINLSVSTVISGGINIFTPLKIPNEIWKKNNIQGIAFLFNKFTNFYNKRI